MLRIGGDGPCKPQVLAAVAASGVADRIQLLGKLSHAQVMQEMAWADLFMLIGWSEPFATVYLEALSVGKPIIGCNDGGIWEALQDGQQGRAVPPHDVPAAAAAMEELARDPALRQRMGESGRAVFERQWEIGVTARRTLQVLHEAAAGAVAPARAAR